MSELGMLQRGMIYEEEKFPLDFSELQQQQTMVDDQGSVGVEVNTQTSAKEKNEDGIAKIGRQMAMVNERMGLVESGVNSLQQKVDTIPRKPKRIRVDRQLVTLPTGEMGIVDFYNDGEKKFVTCFHNVRGECQVYRIKIKEQDFEIPLFGICFSGSNIWIIGRTDKMKERYLYDLFVKKEIKIQTSIPRGTVKQVLYEYFAGAVYNAKSSIYISAMAGWKDGRFYFKENAMLGIQTEINGFPVYEKSFDELPFTENVAEDYFYEMRCIRNPKDRFMIAAYPFLAMLSSIFSDAGYPLEFGLNFILLSKIKKNKIGTWLKIFNRRSCAALNTMMSEKKWQKELQRSKDEVIFLDCSVDDVDNNYTRHKNQKRLMSAFRIVSGEEMLGGTSGRMIHAGIATLSNRFYPERNVYNIFVTEGWYADEGNRFQTRQIMERVLSSFYKFVEKEMYVVVEIIKKRRGFHDLRLVMLSAICDILTLFWKRKGIDFIGSLGFKSQIDFEAFFPNYECGEDELIRLFIKYFRQKAKDYFFAERGTQKEEKVILYDTEILLVPTGIFDEILAGTAIEKQKNQILLLLKQKNILKTDSEGLAKRISICGKRSEMYMLLKESLNEQGQVDIVALGKEG